ncbi:pali-domain-containing protein [Pisolithus marmoratus]|nr:pali-domain-containing protein [Pisolithus marmoratus]
MKCAVHCILSAIFFLVASVLLIVVSVSLPSMHSMDFTRVNATGESTALHVANETVTQLRFGTWSYCYELTNGTMLCSVAAGVPTGYSVVVSTQNNSVIIGSSWTRGLALHVVAALATGLAAILLPLSQSIPAPRCISFTRRTSVTLVDIFVMATFTVDGILYVYLKSQMTNLGFGGNTQPGPAFWMTLAAMIVALLGGGIIYLDNRRKGPNRPNRPEQPPNDAEKLVITEDITRKTVISSS